MLDLPSLRCLTAAQLFDDDGQGWNVIVTGDKSTGGM
jgi:hypothetical protein